MAVNCNLISGQNCIFPKGEGGGEGGGLLHIKLIELAMKFVYVCLGDGH